METKKTIFLGYELIQKIKVPVILCEERTDIHLIGSMKFYCDYCKKNHYHGKCEGYRIAHCHNPESPFHTIFITLNKNYKFKHEI